MGYLLPAETPETRHPAEDYLRLVKLPEHRHLSDGEARVEWLFRTHAEVKAGRTILGTAFMPTVNGRLAPVFDWLIERLFGEPPAFLIVLDFQFWADATPREREILVYHEMLHCTQALDPYGAPKFDRDGLPVWAIQGHDVEEFAATVRRYGAYSEDIRQFIAAAGEGDARQ